MGAHTLAGCVVLEISHDNGLDIVCKARGKRKVEGKKMGKKKQIHVCIMAAPKGNGLAVNVNNPMAADSIHPKTLIEIWLNA